MSKLDDLKQTIEPRESMEKKIDQILKNKQPQKPEEKPIVKPNHVDTKFTNEERKKIIDDTITKYKRKGRIRRREKKMVEDMEYDPIKTTQNTTLGLAVIGLIFLVLLQNMFPNEAMYTIVILVGSFMFIPVGMIVGWIFLDPVMRCKILRKASKRNYGIVNFVGKGKRIVSKIKNFDYGLIWQNDDCWVLTKDRIYQLTKDGNAANDGYKMDPNSVVTLVDTVPVVFVDMDSMEPLSIIQQGRTPVYPSEIGPSCKAWMDNQRAKMIAGKKREDILLYIVLAVSIGAIVVCVLTMQKVDELAEQVKQLSQAPP